MVQIKSIETAFKELEQKTNRTYFTVSEINRHLERKGLVMSDYSNSAMLHMIRKCNVGAKREGKKYLFCLKKD